MNGEHRDRHRRGSPAPLPGPLKRVVARVDWTGVVIFGVVFILIVQAVAREVIV